MAEKPVKNMYFREVFRTLKNALKDNSIHHEVILLKKLAKKTLLWILIAEAVMVIEPYPVKWFFDALNKKLGTEWLIGICSIIVLIYLLGTRIHMKMDRPRNKFFWLFWATLWNYSQWRQQKLSTDWHIEHSTGEKESIVAKNVTKIEALVDEILFNTFPITLRIIFTSIGVWWLGLHFGVIATLALATFTLSLIRTEKIMDPLRKEFRIQMKKIERTGSELVRNWRTLKQFGIEDQEYRKNKDLLMDFCDKEQPRFNVFLGHYREKEDIVTLFRGLMYASIFFFSDKNQWGSIILATAWMERLFSNLYRFYNLQRQLNEGKQAIKELCEVLDLIPSVRQLDNPKWPEKFDGSVEFSNVSFRFSGSKESALRNINLRISPNQCVALVGRSGSGKTTFASLLMREYDPTEGQILIDGINLRELDYDKYRMELISTVSQDITLFDCTIAENIQRVRPDAKINEIITASKKAYAHEFIQKLKDGYGTMVGEDGVRLSGGQKQRLAIARALVRNPKILILDEATSSLDGESQAEVQKAIDDLIKNRLATIFIIAHRLSTIRQADLVVVLNDGEVAELGTHRQLYKQEGIYRGFLEREMDLLIDDFIPNKPEPGY